MTYRALSSFFYGAVLIVTARECAARDADLYTAATAAAVRQVEPRVVQLRLVGGVSSIEGVPLGRAISGLLLSSDGWVVTTSFGFEDPPTAVIAVLTGGEQLALELVAVDYVLKIALLRPTEADRPGDDWLKPEASPLRVGQTVLAVGRSYNAHAPNVSRGVVSALGRLSARAVQVDASVSSANYGGPLVDLNGHILGLLTPLPAAGSDRMSAEWYDSGIGFAVPIDRVLKSVEILRAGHDRLPGALPFSIDSKNPLASSVTVAKVDDAAAPSLRVGDRLASIESTPVLNPTHALSLMAGFCNGEQACLKLERAGEIFETQVVAIQKKPVESDKKTPRAKIARGVDD
ncbi:putative periplasmic serine endoprotease DegP-like precursor [Pirellulimonas nuda]|uniref:Putative periplasmic serine endoprotease DegP-like n=1 Tax=Pirellulimonas nuda TaxID=2528009 RepID=A0A518DB77_9BACT|nr:S1C family serine protease [Pirellulimonas nuda]QDU88741.1 putative periplasmic serine endoprotease DegP-like precursor [Pirellulimonas nuda]